MAPPAADVDIAPSNLEAIPVTKTVPTSSTQNRLSGPLTYSGSLDEYKSFEVTNVIGREYPEVQLTSLLKDDAKLRDLAITISQRGVVFFRNQDLTIAEQKVLAQKLGELTGKPETSKLHKPALANSKQGIAIDSKGTLDDEVSVIDSEQNRQYYKQNIQDEAKRTAGKRLAGEGWHADISFEAIPADYSILKIIETPEDGGGDTVWASGYEAYDRLSPVFQKIAENLTATHHSPYFGQVARERGAQLFDGERGSPLNRGLEFRTSHPIIRTNPVTGWKSLFGAGQQIYNGGIDGVSAEEDAVIQRYFYKLIAENQDLQVRFRWGVNDVAIWDNRSTFHTATRDYVGKRRGHRVVSLGERPYFDAKSVSRREALYN